MSVVPANYSSGASVNGPIVFTFSEPMDTELTSATFLDSVNPLVTINTTDVWSNGDRVLACTPVVPFAANRLIYWTLSGESAVGEPLSGADFGMFTTGSGSGGGSGTNSITTFNVGILHAYSQTNSTGPSPDLEMTYSFHARTSLASNRTATAVTVTPPGGSPLTLTSYPWEAESYNYFANNTNLAAFDTQFPGGAYAFNVQSATSNQQLSVTVPAASAQPNAPRLSDYTAVQSVNAALSFELKWDAFQGGTAADSIYVDIGGAFRLVNGEPGGLNGTALSVTIPPGTLTAGSNYDGMIGFYRGNYNTNDPNYVWAGYRATATRFILSTLSGTGQVPIVKNPAWVDGKFTFEVTSTAGQPITVLYSTALPATQWSTLTTVDNPSGTVRITDTQSTADSARYYRVRTGP